MRELIKVINSDLSVEILTSAFAELSASFGFTEDDVVDSLEESYSDWDK